ncbi:MAG: protein kinase domain-containing protein [Planctomycetota bacterium]|jgi:predicted Ser/Thr protein kinase
MRCPHCGSRISDTVAGDLKACPVCEKELPDVPGGGSGTAADGAEAAPAAETSKPRRPRVSGATAKFELDDHDDGPEPVAVSGTGDTPPPATPVPETPVSATPAPPKQAATPASGIPAKLGPYEVKSKLGEGGMGAVFEGYDPHLDRRVAIKVLASRLAQNEEFVQRFLAEARAIARVAHPNVASVFSAGSEGSEHYFVMEFIEGESLDDRVEKSGRLTPKSAIGYITQTVRGLAAAHERGIVHRDVKPANLMLDTDDKIKVTDFGLAKSSGENLKLTQAGAVMGSPHFMAPEQGRGEETDLRADIYALGATFYFLLSGGPPYDGDSSLAIILKHQEAPVPQMERAPPSLNRILGKMMAKTAVERYPSYDMLMKDLVRLDRSGLLRDEMLQLGSGANALGPAAAGAGAAPPAAKTPLATHGKARPAGVHTTNMATQKADDEAVLLSQLDKVMKKRPGKSGLARRGQTRSTVPIGRGASARGMGSSSAGSAEAAGDEGGFGGRTLSPATRYAIIGGVGCLVILLLALSPWNWFKGAPVSPTGEDPGILARIEKLRPLLSDESAGTRQTAVRRIGRFGGPTVEGLLRRALKDSSPSVRAEAVSALSRSKTGNVVPAIHRLLADPSPDVRVAAAGALGKLTGYSFADDVDWAGGSSQLLATEAARFMEWWRSNR